jgi:cysteinyl-tRNA synthetase
MNYFNYEVLYVMNVTDIDDKIIRRARREHLFTKYIGEGKSPGEIVSDVTEAIRVRCHIVVVVVVVVVCVCVWGGGGGGGDIGRASC